MALRSLFISILSIVLFCCLQSTARADEAAQPNENKTTDAQSWPSFEKAFQAGVSDYQEKKFEEARLAFTQALQKEPNNVQALTNLALVQFQLGQKGWAVALLRKAHNLDPNFSTPKSALDYILPQMDVKEIPHEIRLWETLRSNLIVPFSLGAFLLMTALTLFSAGWLLLTFMGRRREALREEKPLPPFPTIPVVMTFLFIVFFTLTALKVWDLQTPRATVVTDKVTVYSAPNEKSVALFDLFAGLEIIMNTTHDQWVQVTYPGALTGWVPKASVFQTSGRDQ